MRDFFNWSILQRIENEPLRYLKQRNFGQLSAFLHGYETYLLKLANYENLCQEYANYPSIIKFVLTKYQIPYIGSRHFSSIIALYCEDERELFERYFAILHEYETTYPIQTKPQYVIDVQNFSLKNRLQLIRLRPAMFFSSCELACLRAFIDGYFCCLADYQIPLTEYEKALQVFLATIQSDYHIDTKHEQISWDRLYRFDRDWRAWGNGDNNFDVMEKFFSDLDTAIGHIADKNIPYQTDKLDLT